MVKTLNQSRKLLGRRTVKWLLPEHYVNVHPSGVLVPRLSGLHTHLSRPGTFFHLHNRPHPPNTEESPVKTINGPYVVPYPNPPIEASPPALRRATLASPPLTYPIPLAPFNNP